MRVMFAVGTDGRRVMLVVDTSGPKFSIDVNPFRT